jgi:hypothetical protein
MLKGNKMYIIKNSPDDYEGCSKVVAYTQDITKANAYVDKMNAFVSLVKAERELQKKHRNDYIEINPCASTKVDFSCPEFRVQRSIWLLKRKAYMELYDSTLDLIMQEALKDDADRTYWHAEEVPELAYRDKSAL